MNVTPDPPAGGTSGRGRRRAARRSALAAAVLLVALASAVAWHRRRIRVALAVQVLVHGRACDACVATSRRILGDRSRPPPDPGGCGWTCPTRSLELLAEVARAEPALLAPYRDDERRVGDFTVAELLERVVAASEERR